LAQLKPVRVREISESAVKEILNWIPCLEKIAMEEYCRLSDPIGLDEMFETFHFTETQKHQLKRKTVRAVTLGKLTTLPDWIGPQSFSRGKEILRSLDELLSDTEGAED
jgi:hypothetical protein